MASYNGFVASLIKGSSTGGEDAVLTGISTGIVTSKLPFKHYDNVLYGVHTQGVSGTYAVYVVGQVGGASYVIAGLTGIAADGGTILGAAPDGSTSSMHGAGPPVYCSWESAEDGCGFTSSVFMTGSY